MQSTFLFQSNGQLAKKDPLWFRWVVESAAASKRPELLGGGYHFAQIGTLLLTPGRIFFPSALIPSSRSCSDISSPKVASESASSSLLLAVGCTGRTRSGLVRQNPGMSSRDLVFFCSAGELSCPLALLFFVRLETSGTRRYFEWAPLKAPGAFASVRIRWKALAVSPT